MPKITLEFDHTDYIMSHGRPPRGRGSWAFSESRRPQLDDLLWAPKPLTFPEAKQWLRSKLKSEGVTGWHRVYVAT